MDTHSKLKTVRTDELILQVFDTDVRSVYPSAPMRGEPRYEARSAYKDFQDDWGIGWQMPKHGGFSIDKALQPVADTTFDEMKQYVGRDIHDTGGIAGLREQAKQLRESTDYAIFPEISGLGILEGAQFFRCSEPFMSGLPAGRLAAGAIPHGVLEIMTGYLEISSNAIGGLIDISLTGGKLGCQHKALICPTPNCELIKPHRPEVISLTESKTNGKAFLYVCGDVISFVNDLSDVGVDVVNLVQVSIANMDARPPKEQWGDRIAFWDGGRDAQHILLLDSKADLVAEAGIHICGPAPNGAFILGQVHNIQASSPSQDIVPLLRAAHDFGKSPTIC